MQIYLYNSSRSILHDNLIYEYSFCVWFGSCLSFGLRLGMRGYGMCQMGWVRIFLGCSALVFSFFTSRVFISFVYCWSVV